MSDIAAKTSNHFGAILTQEILFYHLLIAKLRVQEIAMRFLIFDGETYNLTDGWDSGTCQCKEVEFAELEILRDEHGNPTRGGIIGYYLSSAILILLVTYIFYMI